MIAQTTFYLRKFYSCGGFNTPTLCVVTKGIKTECNHLMRTISPDACVGGIDWLPFRALFAAAIALIFISCAPSKLETQELTITKADGTRIAVSSEIARTEAERNRGFMERRHIPDGTGMLFVFENDQILSFWMKNTPTPLSIAFISSDGRIKDIFDMTPYSLAPVQSSGYARYALEVPQGWFVRTGIQVGDRITGRVIGGGQLLGGL